MSNAKYSKSGLFEVWCGFLIEGDCVTPTRIHMFCEATFDTSEAIEAATESNRFDGVDFVEVRPPKAYLERHAKLAAIKLARQLALEDANHDSVPF